MSRSTNWPHAVAAVVACIAGGFLLLGGGGHLCAVLDSRAGQPFDFRFVSLLMTSGILMVPGIIAVATCFWLWRGRTWAYVTCLASTTTLMLYLALLIYMKARSPEAFVGDELYIMTAIAGSYLSVTAAVLLWSRCRTLSTA